MNEALLLLIIIVIIINPFIVWFLFPFHSFMSTPLGCPPLCWVELCPLKIHVYLEPQNGTFLEQGSLQMKLVKLK